MKKNPSHSMKELLADIFGALPPSAAELTARAKATARAEVACATCEAIERVQAAGLRCSTSQQAAMRQFGLEELDAAILQVNPRAARQALEILENEYDR